MRRAPGYTVRAVTYSIVARDPPTGQLGVAVQSHYFSVGSVVPWARPGVGAVATQSVVRRDYGPRGLELMAAGASAPDALAALQGEDPGAATRQVAMVDATGAVACLTGPRCIPCAGDSQSEGVSCQANLVATDTVWDAMLEAFTWESGPLARRLLAALDELGRLLDLRDAYALALASEEMADPAQVRDTLARALDLLPNDVELRFWTALARYGAGEPERAVAELRVLGPPWLELLTRLPEEFAPGARGLAEHLRRG